jgi:hypothetical protein
MLAVSVIVHWSVVIVTYRRKSCLVDYIGRKKKGEKVLLFGIGLVHQGNFPGDSGPFEFAAKRFVTSLTLELFPF